MQQILKVDEEKAAKVLSRIDLLLEKIHEAVSEAESGFMALAFLMVEAKRGAYWTLRGYKSEHEYIETVFPQSRAQYYRLIRIGTNLQKYDRNLLEKMGSSKAEDLVRIHLHCGEVSQKWMKRAEELDKDTFRRSVRNYLDNKDDKEKGDDPKVEDNFLTFRIFGNGINSVNMALETMAKSIGSDKSPGQCLELICVNFNSQFADDGTGHVVGKNSYILSTIQGLVQQLDFTVPDTSERLIGTVAAAVDKNTGTEG